jgi:N-acetyl-1-D-myo-inositol-2-amino-2-deoxy-alpha-D-glucopyranoside deacetylase
MRRREAVCSLALLGVGERSSTFLAFPDQGIARLARRHDTSLVNALRAVIDKIRPTLIVSPSSFDMHSDHRGIAYFAHAAAADTPIVTYVVHGAGPKARLACSIELNEREQQRKHEAIECHVSQLALSRERFLAYAQRRESFYSSEFDVVRVDSVLREWWTAFWHSVRVLFGVSPAIDTQPPQPGDEVAHDSL